MNVLHTVSTKTGLSDYPIYNHNSVTDRDGGGGEERDGRTFQSGFSSRRRAGAQAVSPVIKGPRYSPERGLPSLCRDTHPGEGRLLYKNGMNQRNYSRTCGKSPGSHMRPVVTQTPLVPLGVVGL